MASPTRWTRIWVNSGSWWWTGRPGVLQFIGSQRVRHDWVTELKYMWKLSESESEVAQLCLTLCDPMDCSLPVSCVHGIFLARILEWITISFSWRSSHPRDWTQIPCFVGRRFTFWATREVSSIWKQTKCLSTNKWTEKMWYKMVYKSAMIKKVILSFVTRWMETWGH